ncbi:MAG: hypothetical protein IKR18_11925, partial [Bacteroidaceae bacterium]|nr:hypothetical protein [Bacteroidaceae bacterium]
MRYTKVILRLMFLFSCMLPRRSADSLSYIFFIFFPPVWGMSFVVKPLAIYSIWDAVFVGITYFVIALTLIFKFPYFTAQRHINRLVFKCRYRFLYAMLALLVSFI